MDGKKFYFNKKYHAVTGFKTIDSAKYYFNSNGKMVTEKFKIINGKKYYFGKNGKAKTGYCKVGGTWYICDPDMQMNHPSINSYMRTESTYAYVHTCNHRYTLKISEGKVSWK